MKGKVISVFAGLGKTTVGYKYKNVCDLQSSPYRYDYTNIKYEDYEKMKCTNTRIINSQWPNNYIEAIKEAVEKYDVVLLSSNLDVRNILLENHIEFLFVLPSKDCRQMLLDRYKNRNNSDEMIKEVMYYFDNWSRKQEDYEYPIRILEKDKYLEDLLLELKLLSNKYA